MNHRERLNQLLDRMIEIHAELWQALSTSECHHPQAEYAPGEDWQCPECDWQGSFFHAELTD